MQRGATIAQRPPDNSPINEECKMIRKTAAPHGSVKLTSAVADTGSPASVVGSFNGW